MIARLLHRKPYPESLYQRVYKRLYKLLSIPGQILCTTAVLAMGNQALAATATTESTTTSAWVWNLVIAVVVILVLAASAALPLASLRQWTGRWRLAAAAPLVILVVWVGIIVIARATAANSHQLWPFEMFAWAMLNMIYMVVMLTAKRTFDKADALEAENKD